MKDVNYKKYFRKRFLERVYKGKTQQNFMILVAFFIKNMKSFAFVLSVILQYKGMLRIAINSCKKYSGNGNFYLLRCCLNSEGEILAWVLKNLVKYELSSKPN